MSNHWSHTVTPEDLFAGLSEATEAVRNGEPIADPDIEVFHFSFNDPAALRVEIIEMLAEEAEDHEIIEMLAEEAENQHLMLCDDEWASR
jgi:hypothetical protein